MPVTNQAYNPKNFNELLSYYAAIVKNAMLEEVSSGSPYDLKTTKNLSSETPFMPESWTIVTTNSDTNHTTTEVIPNSGHVYGQSILTAFRTTAESIRDSLMTLFINYDDPREMWQEDFNFNLINAYAAASQSLQWYNKTTEEFEDMPEYWFTRGCWYEMLPMCTKGDYIKAYHQQILSVVDIIKKYRKKFEEYEVYMPMSDDDEYGYSRSSYYGSYRSYSSARTSWNRISKPLAFSRYGNTMYFIRSFWGDNLSSMQTEINRKLEPIWKFGRETNYPEQNASTAKLKYVTKLASDFEAAYATGKTSISTAQTLSKDCGTYDAKAANLKLSK